MATNIKQAMYVLIYKALIYALIMLLTIVALILVLTGFSLDEWRFKQALDERIAKNEVHIQLSSLTDFAWQKVCISDGYIASTGDDELWELQFYNCKECTKEVLPVKTYRFDEYRYGLGMRTRDQLGLCIMRDHANLLNEKGKLILIEKE